MLSIVFHNTLLFHNTPIYLTLVYVHDDGLVLVLSLLFSIRVQLTWVHGSHYCVASSRIGS